VEEYLANVDCASFACHVYTLGVGRHGKADKDNPLEKRRWSIPKPQQFILIITIVTLLWMILVAVTAGLASADKLAQIIIAITTVFYAGVFALGYYLMIQVNRETIREMRQNRLSGGRPQVIVEARYSRLPMVDLVVKNVSGGVAKDIKFDFSAPLEDSSGFVLSDLPYFREGMNFLGPGEEVACFWDELDPLVASLRQKELNKGVAVTVRYKDLAEQSYETDWQINPLLYEGNRHVHGQDRRDVEDLVALLRRISGNAHR
jgi:hypothetical protein